MNTNNLYDVIIIGGGPAGLTAAIYLARARYRVLVVEKEGFGGQITITADVVNYPGVMKTSGKELTKTMRRQAEHFGAEFLLANVDSLEFDGDIKTVSTSRGKLFSFGVLLATGAHPRTLGFEGEARFKGHGVAYCATCDGEFFTGREVFVIGGGFAAAEESVFLTKYASHVTILMITEDFTCAKSVADQAYANEKITVINNTEVEGVYGDTAIRKIRYKDTATGNVTEYSPESGESFGVFVFAGYEPATELVRGLADLDDFGYIITDKDLRASVDGLFAAGDICVKSLRQVATAVGDGALSATNMEHYVADMQRKTGVIPRRPEIENRQADSNNHSELFSPEMISSLKDVFARMENPLILELYLDDTPAAKELKEYMNALSRLTERITVKEKQPKNDNRDDENEPESKTSENDKSSHDHLPFVRVLKSNGEYTGLSFHGVPGGHVFTSFVLGLYNAAGKGQGTDEDTLKRIQRIDKDTSMKIMVSLSCTMCPELVTAAQKIAAENAHVSAEVFDLRLFPDLKEKYNVMSVPCLVVNDSDVHFGKKNVEQLLDLLETHL